MSVSPSSAEAAALSGLGLTYNLLGEVRRAIDFYEQALTIFREIGRCEAEALALISCGAS
jgi:hypothetical protein